MAGWDVTTISNQEQNLQIFELASRRTCCCRSAARGSVYAMAQRNKKRPRASPGFPPSKFSKITKSKPGDSGRGRRKDYGEENASVMSDARPYGDFGAGGNVAKKRLHPQTRTYFLEIASIVTNSGRGGDEDADETDIICARALEESKGQELQLACDPSCGRVLQTLLKVCSVSQAIEFLMSCHSVAVEMVLDASASHIFESALESISRALFQVNPQAEEWFGTLERMLFALCQEFGAKAVEIMTNRYGSHVLRSLLSLLNGEPTEILSQGKPGVKSSPNLADKLGASTNKSRHGHFLRPKGHAFSDILESLGHKILENSVGHMTVLRADVSAGPVLQALLKAVQGNQGFVGRAIAMILGCDHKRCSQDVTTLENASIEEVIGAMEDRNGSHLMEVVVRSAPNALYFEMFQRFFRKRLVQLSLHPSANYVVQGLIASARHEGQVNVIFEELESKFADLVCCKRSGVIAALLAACERFGTRQKEACRALSAAVNPSRSGAPTELVPRVLHLESFSEDGKFFADLSTFSDTKLSVIGSVILQTIFTFPQEFSQQFCASVAAMETKSLLRTVQDPSGSRVLEAFLESSATPTKHKHRVISKLEGYFAELSRHPIGCFAVEKCFGGSDIRLKEMIVSELAPLHTELLKSRNGAHISSRCDIIGYARQPDQWRMRQSTKQTTHKSFSELFSANKEKDMDHDKQEETFLTEVGSHRKTDVTSILQKEKRPRNMKTGMKGASGKGAYHNEKLSELEAMLKGT